MFSRKPIGERRKLRFTGMFGGFSPSHLLIVALIAVLLFGDRLPEVMRSLGRSMIEFKKGMRGIESAIETAANSSARRSTAKYNEATYNEIDDREEITAPRFEPPPTEPRLESAPQLAQPDSEMKSGETNQPV